MGNKTRRQLVLEVSADQREAVLWNCDDVDGWAWLVTRDVPDAGRGDTLLIQCSGEVIASTPIADVVPYDDGCASVYWHPREATIHNPPRPGVDCDVISAKCGAAE